MKKLLLPPSLMLSIAAALTSCSKDDEETPTPVPPTPVSTTPPTPVVEDADGVLVSLRVGTMIDMMGMPVTTDIETAVASFFTSTGSATMVDAGAVTVNDSALSKQTNNAYLKMIGVGTTTLDLGFDGGSAWSVGGAGSVAGFTHNHNAAFPDFDGTLPSSITKASGVTVDLGSNVSNADSVYVMVASGDKYVLKRSGGDAASATLSASDLEPLATAATATAFIEVVPFRIDMAMKGGKNYAFIKEYAAVKNVTIN